MTGAFFGHRDGDHLAVPDVFHGSPRFEGTVIVRRCVECGGSIWRTAERLTWSHSIPSRTSLLADPRRVPTAGPVDAVLTRHLPEGV